MKKIKSIFCMFAVGFTQWVTASNLLPIGIRPVDPCTLVTHRSTLLEETVQIPGYGDSAGMDIYVEKSVKLSLPGRAPIALIINGNGYAKDRYVDMARFLAHNGFVVGVAEREGVILDSLFPLNALNSIFAEHQIDDSSPVALIGHSRGGYVVNEAAIENVQMDLGFNIKSIINVAPNITNEINQFSSELNGYHAKSFLSLWGSRDQDMQGKGGLPREGIAAYDRVGTESSTTCGSPPCFINPQNLIEKVSVYINGANHGELMGTRTNSGTGIPDQGYLSPSDEFCIGKAYINANLHKYLHGENSFDKFLRNESLPPSLQNISSNKDDDLGGAPGSPLRIYHQFSPVQKRSIENFEDNHYTVFGKSAHVLDFILEENSNTGSPIYYRHLTDSLLVAWEEKNASQYIGFTVPSYARNAGSFTHLSMRIGLVNDMPYPMYANDNNDELIRIGLRDTSYRSRYQYHTLGRPDTHSTMQTVVIPLDEFTGVNLSQLQMVYLSFNPNTKGTLIMDNIEFIRQ